MIKGYDLEVREFAQLFGCSDSFSDECKEYIAKSDFGIENYHGTRKKSCVRVFTAY